MKITEHKNGAWTVFERTIPSGYYIAKLYKPSGELADKVSCDTYAAAREYLRAFNKIAKGF